MKKDFFGIDIAQEKFDVFHYSSNSWKEFRNNKKGFKSLLSWSGKIADNEIHICFENTGLYSQPLAVYLWDKGIPFYQVPALEIKRSLGIRRGKSDKLDAKVIAAYAYKNREELKPTEIAEKSFRKLKRLVNLRNKLNKQQAGYRAAIKAAKSHDPDISDNKVLLEVQEEMLEKLNEKIKQVEKEISEIIKQNDKVQKQYKMITSVNGLGPVAAWYTIAYTEGFRKIKKGRKFSCYIGVAPFEESSGKSNKGSRVSHLAQKKIKAIFHMAAMSAVKHNKELRAYKQKRDEKGKNEMSTLNIIRNKLISRAFAAVKRGKPYVETLDHMN